MYSGAIGPGLLLVKFVYKSADHAVAFLRIGALGGFQQIRPHLNRIDVFYYMFLRTKAEFGLFIYTAEGNRSWVLSVRYKQSEQHAQKTTLSVFSELVFNVHGFIATTSPPSSLAWFDANLATHLSAQSMDEGNLSHQLIYSHPTWDISELQRRMADGLSKAGWHTDVGSVGALSFWRQGSRRLMTALVSMQNGSAVFVSLQEGTGPLRQIETHSAKRRPSPLRPLGGSAQR